MHKVNLKDLAHATNISISSVSKALRDSHEISSETKKKVIAKAQEMGYTPNPYAGFLRNLMQFFFAAWQFLKPSNDRPQASQGARRGRMSAAPSSPAVPAST